ncbi:MAG: hypothetical protein WD114_00175 [Phycisphaerales bacterium]
MPTGTTIAAISTAPGTSTRAMIRISGPECRRWASDALGIELASRGTRHARIGISAGRALPVVVLFYPGPGSYTGEYLLPYLPNAKAKKKRA